MRLKKLLINHIGITVGLLATATVVVYAQSSWSGPTALPPQNNTAAPLNVSLVYQFKKRSQAIIKNMIEGVVKKEGFSLDQSSS